MGPVSRAVARGTPWKSSLLMGLVFTSFFAVWLISPAKASEVVLTGDLVNIVLDEERSQLYVADRAGNSIIVVNTTNNQVYRRIGVGLQPIGMDISADGSELYVGLSTGKALVALNLTSLAISRSINLTVGPVDLVAGRLGRVYFTDGDRWEYPRIIDTIANVEVGPITGADLIHGGLVRMSPDRRTLYVAETGITRGTIFEFAVQSAIPIS